MEEDHRGRVWRLYGWFTALMACGSCVGAVAWAALMMGLVNAFKGNTSIKDPVQLSSLFALAYSWRAVFTVLYAVEFLCLSAAKLMVLDRMAVFAAPQDEGLQTRWALAGRVVMTAVVLGNAVGLAANAAAAVHYHKAAQAAGTSSAAYAANNTKDGQRFLLLSQEELQRGGSMLSVQSFSEFAVLLLIVAAFVAAGVLSARRVSLALRRVEKMRAVQTFNNPVSRAVLFLSGPSQQNAQNRVPLLRRAEQHGAAACAAWAWSGSLQGRAAAAAVFAQTRSRFRG
jgi:hypothetical protein